MHPCSEEPGPNTRVALAYPEDNPLGGMWSGLKKGEAAARQGAGVLARLSPGVTR